MKRRRMKIIERIRGEMANEREGRRSRKEKGCRKEESRRKRGGRLTRKEENVFDKIKTRKTENKIEKKGKTRE